MRSLKLSFALAVATLLLSQTVLARPIVFARSTTVMAEFREGAMGEAQVFYAPTYNWSFGLGHLELDSGDMDVRHSVTYARANLLAKRWNRENSQANVFLWGGVGQARVGGYWVLPVAPGAPPSEHDHGGQPAAEPYYWPGAQEIAWNSGGQIDFETRRFYSSLKSDYYWSRAFIHRTDTLQLGVALNNHDVNTLATWLIVSGRNYYGNMHEGQELALLLRFFKKRVWLEAGVNLDGGAQAMAMFTF
jgi:hypothetical protein